MFLFIPAGTAAGGFEIAGRVIPPNCGRTIAVPLSAQRELHRFTLSNNTTMV
jgi:hypothetical protein